MPWQRELNWETNMAVANSTQKTVNQDMTRRRFLAAGCMTVSGAGIGLSARRLWGASASTPITNIDPGFIGPQFFDEQEEQALLEVIESRAWVGILYKYVQR